jgi:cytoskeletal protein CcmA (bactofilin family)
MFSSNSNPKKPGDDKRPGSEATLSIIASGNVIDGNVYSEGDIRVEGKVLGKLVCKSKLVVGHQGYVKGVIDSSNATIAGQVDGTIMVRDVLQIQETGRIYGDIITEKLIMLAGGVFTGSCKMGKEAVEILKASPQPAFPTESRLGQAPPINLNKATADAPNGAEAARAAKA